MLNTHPQRWNDRFGPWAKELVWQNVKNVVKRVIVRRLPQYDLPDLPQLNALRCPSELNGARRGRRRLHGLGKKGLKDRGLRL